MLRKNTAGQFIHIQGVDATTGGIKSGVTWTIRRCIDGTFAAATGTATEDGTTGWYKFALSQADTNGNNLGFNFTGTGAVPQTVNVITTACDPTTATNFGITALPAVASGSAGAIPVTGTGSNQISVASGQVIIQAGTGAGQLDFTSGVVKANAVQLLGTAWLTPGTAGTPDVNAKLAGGTAWGSGAITAGSIAAAAMNGKGDWSTVTPTNLTAAQIATGIWQDTTAGDFTTSASIGKSIMNGVALGTGLTINAYTGNTVQTGDAFARLGAPAGASVSADVAAAKVDTAAIKVQTDKMTFSVTGYQDVNIRYVNSIAVNGAGTVGSPWGP